jgi:hypothetical protein
MNSIYGRRGLSRPRAPRPQPPANPVLTASEGLTRVLRQLYVAGTDSGHPRTTLPERYCRGSRPVLRTAEKAGLVRRCVRADRMVFWSLTAEGRTLLGL